MTGERRDGLDGIVGDISVASYLGISAIRWEALELACKHGFSHVRGAETVSGNGVSQKLEQEKRKRGA